MADVLGGGAEPSAKRAKLSVAGFEADVSEFLRTETLHLAAASGVLLGADGPFAHAPCSLLPYPFPASLFAQAKSLATPFNLLVDRISRDLEWLCAQVRSVVAHDEFTRKLLEIAEVIREEGAPQPLQLGIYRSDYMVHQPSDDATPRLLQVELNTISCSFVALAVVYFRAGYTPNDYPSDAEWQARLLLERSFAIKCPSIGQHLAGTKKVQQVLAAPANLARFVSPEQAAVLRSCFAGLHGLEEGGGELVEQAVKAAIATPEAYVLKPQREGGGNNLYGEQMAEALTRMDAAERASFILMERILPPTHAMPLMRDGLLDGGECISELGVYGVFLGDGRQVLLNEQAGHLLRAKLADVDEGGVCAGFAVLSSPVLYP